MFRFALRTVGRTVSARPDGIRKRLITIGTILNRDGLPASTIQHRQRGVPSGFPRQPRPFHEQEIVPAPVTAKPVAPEIREYALPAIALAQWEEIFRSFPQRFKNPRSGLLNDLHKLGQLQRSQRLLRKFKVRLLDKHGKRVIVHRGNLSSEKRRLVRDRSPAPEYIQHLRSATILRFQKPLRVFDNRVVG